MVPPSCTIRRAPTTVGSLKTPNILPGVEYEVGAGGSCCDRSDPSGQLTFSHSIGDFPRGSLTFGAALGIWLYCCFSFTVVDSEVVVFNPDPAGLDGSICTSVLRVLLVDSVEVLGAGASTTTGAGAGAAAVVAGVADAGACWQPVSVKAMAVSANAAKNL